MTGQRFLIRPLDTLFFRDGRPFNQDDEGMADVRSVFPPWPTVMAGAFRAAMARAQGWEDGKSWISKDARDGKSFKDVLGDGPHNTGQLEFGPPVVLREVAKDRWERLYPAPLHLLGKETPQCWTLTFLRPDEERPFTTDLGETCLPAMTKPVDGAKPLAGRWLTPAGMGTVLAGRRPGPDDIVPESELWAAEFRVGLQRSSASRTAEPGMLYAASHVRLVEGVARDRDKPHQGRHLPPVALGLEVEKLPTGWQPQAVTPVGGFQRLAEIKGGGWDEAEPPPKPHDGRYIVVLTSPLPLQVIDKQQETGCCLVGWNRPGGRLPDLPGEIVSACLDRPLMIGGWDGRRPEDRTHGFLGPIAMTPHLPAGSVFFMRCENAEIKTLFDGRPCRIGVADREKLGFGACLIGRWPDKE